MAQDILLLKEQLGEDFLPILFENIGSTNVKLLEDVRSGKADVGTVYIAERQSAGRGRLGRSFISPKGGIYMSFCTGDVEYGLSTVICAVAVADTFKDFGFSPEVKWVNDILIGGKKVCGILAQSLGDGKRAVIGVGLNLRTEDIPEELSEIAIGLDVFGDVPRPEIIEAGILKSYKALSVSMPDGRENIIEKYKSYMTLLGEKITVLQTGETLTAKDIDKDGALMAVSENGKTVRLASGEISIRKITTK
ncbi:MAG: biotin--[acetyl-CoA-carboxylase] ligase [Ruminococcaceae bacterium]|nr:biotin--[acetyl-CoA-carboxylase] ligase [Oscillospiraceae bacterium]